MFKQPLFTALHQICKNIRDKEIENLKSNSLEDKQLIVLKRKQVLELSERIRSLPQICRDVLLARYCYKMDADEVENLYDITDARGNCLYAEKLLGYALDLKDNETILPENLAAACKLADEYISGEIKRESGNFVVSTFSRKHNRRMRDIIKRDGKQSRLFLTMRYVAIFALVLLLSGAITLSVNAELRGKFFNWVVTTYDEFSSFGNKSYLNDFIHSSEIRENLFEHAAYAKQVDELASYAPENIPDGFYLAGERTLGTAGAIKEYIDSDGKRIRFYIGDPQNTPLYDTEDSEIKTITLFGQDAFVWERRVAFIVFQIDGFACDIITDLDTDAAVQIAQSVKHYENRQSAINNRPIYPQLGQMIQLQPAFVPDNLSLTSFYLGVDMTVYEYSNEYPNDFNDMTVYIKRVSDTERNDNIISELTEWETSRGIYLTWDYGDFKCMISEGRDIEEMKRVAESMRLY